MGNIQIIPFIIFVYFMYTSSTATGPDHDKVVACYWETRSIYRPGLGKFEFEDINPNLCSHLILAFIRFVEGEDSIEFLGEWKHLDVGEDNKNQITKLKERYPHLKVLVSIGGWVHGGVKFSRLAGDANRRKIFAKNTLNFVRKHDFDGLDVIWLYPTKRGGNMDDKVHFVELIKDLRKEFDKHNLLLSTALGGDKSTIDMAYDIRNLSLYLDYMFMMCYDYYGLWYDMIGPSAPLYGSNIHTVEYCIKYTLKLGADPTKLILGIAFYGRTFLLLEATNSVSPPRLFGAKHKNYSFNGPYMGDEDIMAYNEVCEEILNHKTSWSVYWDAPSRTPYAVNGEKLIAYENDRSISEKTKFAMYIGLRGVMVWSLDMDDFHGICYETIDDDRDFPLLREVNREMSDYVQYGEYYKLKPSSQSLIQSAVSRANFVVLLIFFLVTFMLLI